MSSHMTGPTPSGNGKDDEAEKNCSHSMRDFKKTFKNTIFVKDLKRLKEE